MRLDASNRGRLIQPANFIFSRRANHAILPQYIISRNPPQVKHKIVTNLLQFCYNSITIHVTCGALQSKALKCQVCIQYTSCKLGELDKLRRRRLIFQGSHELGKLRAATSWVAISWELGSCELGRVSVVALRLCDTIFLM